MTAQTSPHSVTVRELDLADAGRWDRFVDACPEATFFHRAGWKAAVERSFGHTTAYIYAESGGEICGVLPLVLIRSRLFGTALISNGFCVEGGIAATTEAARRALTQEAMALAKAADVDYLEFRGTARHNPDWACQDELYAVFRKSLPRDPDQALKEIPRKQRAVVRASLRNTLTADRTDSVDGFFDAYAASVHGLGTPVLPRRWFRELKRVFGDACEVLEVRHDGQIVTALMSFYHRGRVLPYYGGGTAAARPLGAYNFMYWDVMRRACEAGLTEFDFGRSKRGTGPYDYKTFWGFEPTPLSYEYLIRRGGLPQKNPLNPKYKAFIALWKRMPLPLANALGPYLSRDLG